MFFFRSNVNRFMAAQVEINDAHQRSIDAHQRCIDALLETNAQLRLRLDRLEGRVVRVD